MRRLVWLVNVSLDGFFEGPNGELDWHTIDDEFHQHMNDVIGPAGVMLEGRVMYQLMAGFWPTADQDPASTPVMDEFARIWREMPKIVYSRTITEVAWNARIVPEVVAEDVRAMKAEPGGYLLLGGADLATEFLRQGLIDELRMYVHPVVVGVGRRALPPIGQHLPLRLIETHRFTNGVVLLRYEIGQA